jgi:hypothetical protein
VVNVEPPVTGVDASDNVRVGRGMYCGVPVLEVLSEAVTDSTFDLGWVNEPTVPIKVGQQTVAADFKW